uniref:Ig-like domain-containing protein n=1 Tax=Leptobrachium leishanense TaxID=445787 RepID=A0A8C5MWE5_9ANUR
MPRPGSIFTLDRRSINIQSADSILSAYIQSFGLSGGFSSVRLCPRIQRDLSLLRDHNMRGNMGLTPLLLFIMRLSEVYSGHSLQYYHTAVSVPGHGLPVYISVGYVDGIEISHYRSDDSRAVPVAPWMQKVEDPGYWERDTQIGKSNEASYKVDMNTLMKRYNQTGGFHSYQRMHGCELRDDGSIRGYWQYGFDGKDFLALDTERWVYIALTDQAQVSAQKWNSPELRAGERRKNYLENICIPWLRIHLKNGQEELERRVRPEVKVSSRPSGSAMKLHCQVYGFHPRDVDVTWKKNGMDIPSDEAKQVLPNSDGTYQLRASVEVTPEDGASYSCHVDHSSLDEPLLEMWGSLLLSLYGDLLPLSYSLFNASSHNTFTDTLSLENPDTLHLCTS